MLPALTSLTLCLLLVLTGCAPAGAGGQAGGDEPVRATGPKNISTIISGNPPSLEMRFLITTNNANNSAVGLYKGQLIFSNATQGIFIPKLATEMPSLDNGLWKMFPDNTMETRLTIRRGAAWHDGIPLTTRDILLSDEVAVNREVPQSINTTRAQFVDQITAVDDSTIAIRWKQPFIFADSYSPEMLPAHILEAKYRADPVSITTDPWVSTEYVGTGPFKLKEFMPGSWQTLTAFDGYVLGRPKLDEIRVLFMPDSNSMMATMLSGEADLSIGSANSIAQAVQLRSQNWEGQVSLPDLNPMRLFGHYIDPMHPVLTDKRFKKAMMFSLDRPALVEGIQTGYGGPVDIPLDPADPNYNAILPKVEKYPYDPRRATEMFESVGLTKGPDGFLRFTASGQRLDPIEYRTTGEQDVQVRMIAATSDMFKQAGLEMNQVIIPQTRTADRPYRVNNPGFEILSGGTYGPAAFVGLLACSKVPTPQNNYSSGNNPRYCNPQWDALVDRYSVTIPQGPRLELLTELIVWYMDELMIMPMILSAHPQFASKRMIVPDNNAVALAETWDMR